MSDGSSSRKSESHDLRRQASKFLSELESSVDALRSVGGQEADRLVSDLQALIDDIRSALGDADRAER